MGDLTTNFSLHEFACRCGCGGAHFFHDSIFLLADVLQAVRDRLGKPITVSSGYRCATYNNRVGGAPTSQHLLGTAADIVCPGHMMSLHRAVLDVFHSHKFPYGFGLGIYADPNFVHLDIRRNPARWAKIGEQDVNALEVLKRWKETGEA